MDQFCCTAISLDPFGFFNGLANPFRVNRLSSQRLIDRSGQIHIKRFIRIHSFLLHLTVGSRQIVTQLLI